MADFIKTMIGISLLNVFFGTLAFLAICLLIRFLDKRRSRKAAVNEKN